MNNQPRAAHNANVVSIALPTVEELCEAMAATGDRPGWVTVTRTANGFPTYAAAVLDLLERRAARP